jgi:hypothetical protein
MVDGVSAAASEFPRSSDARAVVAARPDAAAFTQLRIRRGNVKASPERVNPYVL